MRQSVLVSKIDRKSQTANRKHGSDGSAYCSSVVILCARLVDRFLDSDEIEPTYVSQY